MKLLDTLVEAVSAGVKAFKDGWNASDELEAMRGLLEYYYSQGYVLHRGYGKRCRECGGHEEEQVTSLRQILDVWAVKER